MVERAVADVRIFSDPTFLASTKSSIKKILDDERGISGMPKGSSNQSYLIIATYEANPKTQETRWHE